jgi:hypothetical protein
MGDQRNDGESNFNSGDGSGQMAQPWVFMMMMIQVRQHTPTEKPAGLEAMKLAAPPLDSPCDGPVSCPGGIKTLVK